MSCVRSRVLPLLAGVVLLGSLGAMPEGCDGPLFGLLGDSGGTGTLKVLITDAPFPFDLIEEANVYITRVEARLAEPGDDGDDMDGDDADDGGGDAGVSDDDGDDADGNDDDGVDDGDDDDGDDLDGDDDDDHGHHDGDHHEDDDGAGGHHRRGRWIVIQDEEQEFNLLDLQNGQTDVLAEAEVEAGRYTQLRLIVSHGEVVLTDGSRFNLEVPSGDRTGIKLHLEFDVPADGEATLLLDVDLSKLFKPIPGGTPHHPDDIREFMFRPSIAMRLIELRDAGSISGTVTDQEGDPLEDVTVTASREGEDRTKATDENGEYTVPALVPGTYTVTFSAEGFEDAIIEDVEVTAGEATEDVDAVLVAVAVEGEPGTGESEQDPGEGDNAG